jgi:hypothetical protein
MTDDEKVAQRYRELGAEEPPRALDEAILAAARREAGAGRQRWYAPLATAAVLVLAVAVTLNMQRERRDIDSPAPQAAAQRADQPAGRSSAADAEAELKLKAETQVSAAKARLATETAAKEMAVPRQKDIGQLASAAPAAPAAAPPPVAREPQPFPAEKAAGPAGAVGDDARAGESSVSGAAARRMEERTSRDAEAASNTPRLGALQAQKKAEARADMRAETQADTPERELERIAQLRAQGRHDEADKALAEFRKRYPDFRIPEPMRERVERR